MSAGEHLIFSGATLFWIGLLNGVAIGSFKNPRMGLSAHLTAEQNGLSLIAFGLVWDRAQPPFPLLTYWSGLYSMYGLWLGLTLAGVWGTSKATPIMGAGFKAAAWQERVVVLLTKSSSVAMIFSISTIVIGLWRRLEPLSFN